MTARNKIQNAVALDGVTVAQEVIYKLSRLSQRNADAHRIGFLLKTDMKVLECS